MSQLDNIRMGNVTNSEKPMEIVDPNLQRTAKKRDTNYAKTMPVAEDDGVEIIDPNLAKSKAKSTVNFNQKPTVKSVMREGGNTVGDGNGERIIVNPEETVPNIEKPKTNIVADAINDTFKAVERRGKEMQEYADELHETMEALGKDEVDDEVIAAMQVSAQDRPGSYAYMEKHGQSQGFQDGGKFQFYDPEKDTGVIEEEEDGEMYNNATGTRKVDLLDEDDDDVMATTPEAETEYEEEVVEEDDEFADDPVEYDYQPPEVVEAAEETTEEVVEEGDDDDIETTTAAVQENEDPDDEDGSIPDINQDHTITNEGVYMGDDEEEEDTETDVSVEDSDDITPVNTDENMEELRKFVLDNIYPEAKSTKVMSLSDFRINKKIVPSSKIKADAVKSVDWAAYFTGTGFTQSAMSGSEIEILNAIMSDEERSTDSRLRHMLQSLYDHCDSKGNLTFNGWAKRFDARDLNNFCAAQYFACFADSNYQMITCENKSCNYSFFTPNIKPLKMMEFKTPEIKKEFLDIRRNIKNENMLITDSMVPMGKYHYIQFKYASLYDIYVAPINVDPEFSRKYNTAMQMASSIHNIYEITPDGSLNKVGWKEFPNDDTKTLRSKVMAINKVLRSMSSDELQDFIVNLNELSKNDKELDDVRYFTPETTCPRCGKVVEKSYIESMHRYLFMRHRLVALKNIPGKQ